MLGWVKREWGSCFWDGDKRDILQRRILKGSVVFLLSQGMIQSRWDEVEIRQSQLSILFHLWPPKYKKSSCGCRQLGLKGYCSVIHRCFGPHLPCLHKVIAPPPRLQVHLIPGKLVRNHPQCFKHYLKPFFFPNRLVLDRTGLRVHLHGQNWGEDEARIWGSWVCGIPGQLRNNTSDCNLDLIWGCCILISLTLLR